MWRAGCLADDPFLCSRLRVLPLQWETLPLRKEGLLGFPLLEWFACQGRASLSFRVASVREILS